MLLANMATARKIALAFPNTALLRRHEAPKEHLTTRLVGGRGLTSSLHTHTLLHRYTNAFMCAHTLAPWPSLSQGGGDGVAGNASGHKVGRNHSREGIMDTSTMQWAVAMVTLSLPHRSP